MHGARRNFEVESLLQRRTRGPHVPTGRCRATWRGGDDRPRSSGEAGNAPRAQEFRSGISRAKTDTRAQWSIQKAPRANAGCPHRRCRATGEVALEATKNRRGFASPPVSTVLDEKFCLRAVGGLAANAPEDERAAKADERPCAGFGDDIKAEVIYAKSRRGSLVTLIPSHCEVFPIG
jgi:hypothetical protein